MTDIDALLAAEFPVEDQHRYLNHAAVAPWPRRTGAAVNELATEMIQHGAARYPRVMQRETLLRDQIREFINAPSSDDVALLKNTSEGLSVVARGFPWQPGDNVVIGDEEFPSNRIVWESLQDQGVTVKQVNLQVAESPEAAYIDACDSNTRIISVSSVQYASGLRLDLAALGAHCRAADIAFCVDGIQGLGAFPHDVQAMNIDFLVADAHKWLLGPEGLALFYCRDAWRERLQLQQFGWHMVEDPYDFDRKDWQPAHSAQRFECGTQNTLGIFAMSASLSLLLEIGMSEVERRILARSEHLFEAIAARPELELLSAREPGRYAGIVQFRRREKDQEKVFEALGQAGVVCAFRGGGLRYSPHCYNRMELLDEAVELAVKVDSR